MLTEIGPYRIDANGAPYPNAYSWTNKYDTVFVDNPRGTGFSYADSELASSATFSLSLLAR